MGEEMSQRETQRQRKRAERFITQSQEEHDHVTGT